MVGDKTAPDVTAAGETGAAQRLRQLGLTAIRPALPLALSRCSVQARYEPNWGIV
jgi:hypothetical protein